MYKKDLSPDKALQRLQTACAQAEMCTTEAYKKLATWGIGIDDSQKIVAALIRQRYIDDKRYCRAFINDKIQFARWGKRKIYVALLAKRLDKELITRLINEVDEEKYHETALSLLRAKLRTGIDITTYEGRTKLYRFGVSRGYEIDVISKIIHQLIDMGNNYTQDC